MIKELKKYYFHNKKRLIVICTLKFFSALFDVGISAILYLFTAFASESDAHQWQDFLILSVVSIVFIVIEISLRYFQEAQSHMYIDSMTALYRKDMVENILKGRPQLFFEKNSGEMLNDTLNNVEDVANHHFCSVFENITHFITLIFALVAAFCLNYLVAIIIIIVGIILYFCQRNFNDRIAKSKVEWTESISSLSAELNTIFNGGLIIQNALASSRVVKRVDIKNQEVRKKQDSFWKVISKDNNSVGFFIFLCQVVCVGCSCILYYFGYVTSIAVAIAFLQISSCIYDPFVRIMANIYYINSSKTIVKRLSSYSIENAKKTASILSANDFVLSHVTIFASDNELIHDTDFCFKMGKKYLLTGESGIGKTTLLKTLIGYYDNYTGDVTMGDIDIRNVSHEDLNGLIAYCPQDPFLFTGSVLDNITIYSKEPDLALCQQLIDQCGLREFVSKRGLNTELDSVKNAISIGEMQRISLARTLYLDRPIIFLDEITSALDKANADLIYSALEKINDKMVIMISHHDAVQTFPWIDVKLEIKDNTFYVK